MKRSQDKIQHAELMAKIPEGSDRVKVITCKGVLKYRPIAEVAYNDLIQVDKNGIPIVMMASVGRPKGAVVEPANPMVKELIKRKRETVDEDLVLRAAKHDLDSPDVLRQVVLALGEEAACLKFDRMEAERNHEDASALSTKRVKALEVVVNTWIKRKEVFGSKDIDINAPAVRVLASFILDTVREAMTAIGESDEMIRTLFAKTSQLMNDDNWMVDLKNRMKNSG